MEKRQSRLLCPIRAQLNSALCMATRKLSLGKKMPNRDEKSHVSFPDAWKACFSFSFQLRPDLLLQLPVAVNVLQQMFLLFLMKPTFRHMYFPDKIKTLSGLSSWFLSAFVDSQKTGFWHRYSREKCLQTDSSRRTPSFPCLCCQNKHWSLTDGRTNSLSAQAEAAGETSSIICSLLLLQTVKIT